MPFVGYDEPAFFRSILTVKGCNYIMDPVVGILNSTDSFFREFIP